LIAVLAAVAVITVIPVVVVAVQVVTVTAVVTALSVAVTCWSDRTASEQGGEDRKNENVFQFGSAFENTRAWLTVLERCAGGPLAPMRSIWSIHSLISLVRAASYIAG
jgi:hypothetical protein